MPTFPSWLGRRTTSRSKETPIACARPDNPHPPDTPDTAERVAKVLEVMKRIELADLELMVQRAHECDIQQIDDPPEPFPITRQALRMFWHFRCNLEAVEVRVTRG